MFTYVMEFNAYYGEPGDPDYVSLRLSDHKCCVQLRVKETVCVARERWKVAELCWFLEVDGGAQVELESERWLKTRDEAMELLKDVQRRLGKNAKCEITDPAAKKAEEG